MVQLIYFALIIIALLAGAFTYFGPLKHAVEPVKITVDNNGYTPADILNRKRLEQINETTIRGVIQVQTKMDNLAIAQNNFLDSIDDQQQILKGAIKDASDVLLEAKKSGELSKNDMLQLEALASNMQDEQRLLVSKGQDLILLNGQLVKSRQDIAEQMDWAKINTESSLHLLRQRYAMLNEQATDLFNKITDYNKDVKNRMEGIHRKLQDMVKNAVYSNTRQQQNSKDRMRRLMDKEHEDMLKLADSVERYKNQRKDAQDNLTDSKDRLSDLQQHSKDLIDDERQKEEDQRALIQQRMVDQKQRIQDNLKR